MITIATKLRPFSHLFGAKCLIPGTEVVCEAHPHFLRIGDEEIPIDISSDLTLQQDLFRNCVWVFGKNKRIKISVSKDGFTVGSKFFLSRVNLPEQIERLSLGSHKKQDWELISRRMDVAEILPILYDLGQKSFPGQLVTISDYENFYRSSFQGMAVPKGTFLRQVFEKIRSHFIKENGMEIRLLPDNPFPHGRLLNVQTKVGTIDLEWSKKTLKRAVFSPTQTAEISFPHSFRKKMQLHEKGVRGKGSLQLEVGKRVYLDQFFE